MGILYKVDYLRNTACRHISYSIMVRLVKGILNSPPGRRNALAMAQPLLSLLDKEKIEHDPAIIATRMVMLRTLFPWAYCRFARHPEELDHWVRVSGLEQFNSLLATERGVLLAVNHHGPAHMVDFYLAAQGYKVYALQASNHVHRKHMRYAVPEISARLNKIFTRQDLSPGLMQTTIKVRELLRQGEIVIAALDGGQGGSTFRLKLMGSDIGFRYAMPLIASLADAVIIPVFSTLKLDGHIEIRFENPFPGKQPDQSPQDYAMDIMSIYVAMLQNYMEKEPGNIKTRMLSRNDAR